MKNTAAQFFIDETTKAFAKNRNMKVEDMPKEDIDRIGIMMRKQEQFNVAMDAMTGFGKQILEDMANAWLNNLKQQELVGDDDEHELAVDPIMSIEELVDHLNFEVFRHMYPAISFEDGGDRITVTIKAE